ncbi:MAG: hypothetical protein ACLQBB_04660 [Solirubrobacteraceae bacterium]
MKSPLKRNLMLGVALAAVLAGVLIAVLTGGSQRRLTDSSRTGSGVHGEVQIAASYLGLSPRELRRHLRSGESLSEVADSSPGHSSTQLLSKLLAARAAELKREHLPPAAERLALSRLRRELTTDPGHSRRGALVASAAGYLGIHKSQLRAELADGRTLAQIADSTPGRSAQGLTEALVARRAASLALAVKEHRITATEADSALKTLHRRIDREVNRPLP